MTAPKPAKPPAPVFPPAAGPIKLGAGPWLCLAWPVWVIYKFLEKFPVDWSVYGGARLSLADVRASVFMSDAFAFLLLAGFLFITAALGFWALERFSLPWNSALEKLVFSIGLGHGIAAYAVLAAGALQLYYAPVFWILYSAGLVSALRMWKSKGLSALFRESAVQLEKWRRQVPGWFLSKLLLALLLLMGLAMCFVPEVFYDAMVYHLGVPNWYLLERGIKYYPSLYAQFPFARQMLNLLGLALQGESLAKLIHWASGLLIFLTYAALAARYSNPLAALLGGLAFFSMLMVNFNLWTAGIEIGMASFALLATYAWLNGLTDENNSKRWMIVSGIFGGLTLASKYTGALCLFGPIIVMAVISFRKEKKLFGAARLPLLLGTSAFLVFLPWLVKNMLLTGNPAYPYLHALFGGKDIVPARIAAWSGEFAEGAKRDFWSLLKSPWTDTFSELSAYSGPGLFPLGFLGFLAWGAVDRRARRSWWTAAGASVFLYMLLVNWLTEQMRLAIPGAVVLCFLIGHIGAFAYANGSRSFRVLFLWTTSVCAFLGFDVTFNLLQNYTPWNVLSGRESRRDYLSSSHRGLSYYPATRLYDYAEKNLPPRIRLMILGDEKVSPCRVPFLATGVFNDTKLIEWAKGSGSPDELYGRFKRNGVTHLAINVLESVRLKRYDLFNWDAPSLALFCEFWDKHVRLLHVEREGPDDAPVTNLWLCSVLPEPEAASLPRPPRNMVLEIYEHIQAPPTDPDWLAKRTRLLADLTRVRPGVAGIEESLKVLNEKASR